MRRKRLVYITAAILSLLCSGAPKLSMAEPRTATASAPRKVVAAKRKPQPSRPINNTKNSPSTKQSPLRGWDYIVDRLQENGVPIEDLVAIYSDPRMPECSFVPFSVKPREPSSIYESFKRPEHRMTAVNFIQRNRDAFEEAERKLKVPKEVVAAIITIESQAGRNTGNHMILYRLSRLATTNSPENLQWNYLEQKKKDHRITFSDVRRRGRYLERTFLPEIPALISIARKNGVDPLSMKGSSAGAFGLPQFLPSAFWRFGYDGNKDGIVALHNADDAIWSTANYLAHFGFRARIPRQEKRAIIWRYNKSTSYIDTVLELSQAIEKEYLSQGSE
jgi:membrane-bound lytic murein transglycosylase B